MSKAVEVPNSEFLVEQWPIERVKPYPGNPRKNKEAVAGVVASIREFGFRQPIVVDEDGVIIVGHTRLLAAINLKMTTVPVHVATGLSPEKVRAYRIADNATNEIAQWDEDMLLLELKGLEASSFDLDLLGFDDEALATRLGRAVNGGLTDPDEIPPVPKVPVTKPGDLWLLGAYYQCDKCGKEYGYEEGSKMKECPCG